MNDRTGTSLKRLGLRGVVFYLLTIALVWGAVEIAGVLGHAVLDGRLFSPSSIREQARTLAAHSSQASPSAASGFSDRSVETIHPYFGVVSDPDRHPAGVVSDLGFPASVSSRRLLRSAPDTRLIGVFGGSFAGGVGNLLRAVDRQRLGGGRVVIANFARGGYKQPQQLMVLAYLLALGARFDTVINIDGFNEVALPPAENVVRGVNPFYPRQWHMRAQGVMEPETIREIGYLRYLEFERSQWANRLVENSFYRSAVLSLAWRALDQRYAVRAQDARQRVDKTQRVRTTYKLIKKTRECLRTAGVPKKVRALLHSLRGRSFGDRDRFHTAVVRRIGVARAAKYVDAVEGCAAKASTSFTMLGPKYSSSGDDELYRDLAGMWERSSLEMKALCEEYGTRYFHFLQPNQYVAGSKPMTPDEEQIAINEGHRYRRGVINGYPLLREMGQTLMDRGVAFTDLTMIFENNSEVLYDDDCCHLNKRGYGLILDNILETIVADSDDQNKPRLPSGTSGRQPHAGR